MLLSSGDIRGTRGTGRRGNPQRAAMLVSLLLQVGASVGASGQVGSRIPTYRTSAILGQVVNHVNDRGLPTVHVRVANSSERDHTHIWEGTTSDDGRFAAASLPAGVYELDLRRTGFWTARSTVRLSEGEELSIRLEMIPNAIELDPVVIEATLIRPQGAEVAWRFVGQTGRLTRQEISALGAQRVSDLFFAIPGTAVLPDPTGRAALVVLRNGCNPQLVVDGASFAYPVRIDEVLNVNEIEILEVVQGRSAAAHSSNATCGTIRVWTGAGAAPIGGLRGWPRPVGALLFIGSIIGISSLF